MVKSTLSIKPHPLHPTSTNFMSSFTASSGSHSWQFFHSSTVLPVCQNIHVIISSLFSPCLFYLHAVSLYSCLLSSASLPLSQPGHTLYYTSSVQASSSAFLPEDTPSALLPVPLITLAVAIHHPLSESTN